MMLAVYASHLAGVLFGVWIRQSSSVIPEFSSRVNIGRKYPESSFQVLDSGSKAGMTQKRWFKIIGSSLAASLIFFFVTNFAFLYSTYPHNLSGIMAAYVNGLPFFRGTVLGDLSYTAALFGSYQFALYAKAFKIRKTAAA